ncbi:MAG TPA: S9 family peptidase [Pyrinomonadaceae bacterium]|nr:S9 family peptidase [Pyrinomonadaceae bacterium]
MKQLYIVAAMFILLIRFSPVAVHGQTAAGNEAFGIERYLNIRSVSSPSLDSSGDRVAFLTNISGTPQVWMVNASGGWPEQMTFYPDRVDFVSWAPDRSGLIFAKAVGGDENSQLYWMAPDGSQIRAVTNDPKVRYNFGGWSRDSKKISYASNKRNRDFFDVYVMDVSTGREELVYQQDGSNQPVAWSMEGRQLVVSHSNEQLSLDNDLYLVEIATKGAVHLTPHEGAAQFEDVHFQPNGHSLFLTTNVAREFQSLAELNLRTKRIDILDDTPWDVGSVAESQSGGRLAYTINRDGFSELYVRTLDTDGKPLITVPGPKGSPVELPGKGVVSGLSFSRDGDKLAFVFNGARFNGDVWLYDLKTKKLSQVTHSSRAGITQESFVEPQLIHYKSFDGRMIPAWFYRPRQTRSDSASEGPRSSAFTKALSCCCFSFPCVQMAPATFKVFETFETSSRKSKVFTPRLTQSWEPTAITGFRNSSSMPVIVSVHGGPEGQALPTFSGVDQYFLSRGYAILAPNVRGSTGYGKTYSHLDDVFKREDSVKDLAAAVEWLKTEGGADPKRIAVMGGSYGGYMVLAAITLYPDIWSAAVEMFGIANFETNLKRTSGYRRKLREREYGTLDKDLDFLKSISPIYKVDRIRAPLFVLQGRNDPRVPYTESEQIVKALKERNRPVEYILFEDEGHGFVKLNNRLRMYPQIVEFLDKYMK